MSQSSTERETNGMRDLSRLILATGAGAILALSGCKSDQSNTTAQSAAPSGPSDKTITRIVKHDLADDPACKYPYVDVETLNGVVQLGGSVVAEQQKRRAGEIAQSVTGVKQVENNIIVQPPVGRLEPTGSLNSGSNMNQTGKQAAP